MPTPINIKSTIKEPIRFFLMYPRIDRNSLYLQYKKLDGYDGYFDTVENTAYIKIEKRIDDVEVEISMVEFSFEDFIKNRFDDETLISKSLITKFYKKSLSKSNNEYAYEKLLRAFVDNFQKFKIFPFYPESELLLSALIEIVKHAMYTYRLLFDNNPLEIQAKEVIAGEVKLSGHTGHNLKVESDKQLPNYSELLTELSKYITGIHVDEFTNVIKHHSLSPGTPIAQWIGIKRVDAYRFSKFLKMTLREFNICFSMPGDKKLRHNDKDKLGMNSEIENILKKYLQK